MRVWLYAYQGPGAGTRRLVGLAKAVERHGFDGLILAAPGPRRSNVHSARFGRDDAWAAVAAMARGTRRLRLGILLQPAHLAVPAQVAVAAAALDRRSGGRLEIGLAAVRVDSGPAGGLLPPMNEGFTRLDETLAVITGLWWTPPGERFTFTGRYHTVLNHPAAVPAQRPGPPLIISGPGRHTTSYLAARWADEVNVPFRGLDHTVRQYWDADDASARPERRPPDRAPLGRSVALALPPASAPHRRADDTLFEALATLGQYQAIGTDRVYLRLPDGADRRCLDLLAQRILPAFHGTAGPAAPPHTC
ncbi:LLM class flavin-dependent oxidoreductase [Phytohabitans suffuscus]|uniref:LLM class F420-dependent oxidoreductase n=1 Tax=Phytohabitans suffuscus TaxID=624315 RepID=A0A6F8YVG0_9ACTN|nr:LLM class flavin-dependent oxidoreductase [Phytohabitans suffuscus]BCB90127.1 LLM class F420-dependent oxidoreductase [Phytohabitans suffuscus]